MTKLTLEQQELLFANDCKLINLRYEYHGYTGTEKWAIVTELAEEELWVKYPDVIRRYTPFILLSMAQGEVITEYQNYEANNGYSQHWKEHCLCSRQLRRFPFCKGRRTLQNFQEEL